MKKEQKLATSMGVVGGIYLEEGLNWILDRVIDQGLAYKDTITNIFTTL